MTVLEFNSRIVEETTPLRNFALSLTHNLDDALDLLQDTYLKAICYRSKFKENTNLRAWLFTIMKNTFINSYRRSIKKKSLISQCDEPALHHAYKATASSTSDSRLYAREIIKEIERLDEDYKVPFTRYYIGYRYEEIAKQMALPLGTVKSRIFIARKTLMNTIGTINS